MARYRGFTPRHCRCHDIDDPLPSSIIIPLCPCTPRHVLTRAADPGVQKQLSNAVHNILSPFWATSPATSPDCSTPPCHFRRIPSMSSDLDNYGSPTFEFTDVRAIPRTPSSGCSLPLTHMRSHTMWPQHQTASTQDVSPPLLIPAPGAPMPPRSNPPSSASSFSSWEANTMQAACALTELAGFSHLQTTDRACHTIPEVVSDERTERAPHGTFQMDTTSDSLLMSNSRHSKITPPSNNSLSSLDEAATLVQPQLPSPALSHDDIIRSLDSLQYNPTEDPIAAWLAAAPPPDAP